MGVLLCTLLGICAGPAGSDVPAWVDSYLYQPAYSVDDELRAPAEPYLPQPGDIILTCDHSVFWAVTFAMGLTGPPHHACIVVALPNNQLAMFEAGPHDSPHIALTDLMTNLRQYEKEERVWIRRRRVPLTPEQSARLTAFALRQENKPFAVARLAEQLTPLRSRGPLRTWIVGKPHGERSAYFCSELVMESCVVAGLVPAETTRPSATYPRDIFFDHSTNPYLNLHLDLSPGWFPPARWTTNPDRAVGDPSAGR